ncbi:hypothetical protein GmHk_16G046105 [Glycine max]|nr:hypothetical protein GmHk_16G046105 [Glycine max]
MTTQMQRLLNRNNEVLFRRIERLEHQMNPNVGRPYGGNKKVNDGSNRIEGQDRIEGVKLNVSSFKGRSYPDAYVDWEMKIQHAFSYNDYPEEQKVKLAASTFSDYALVWWKKNQREMKREEGREIDTWIEMRRVMRKRYVPTSYSRTMRQKLQRLSQGSLIVEENCKEMEMALVRANIEEDTKAVHDGFTDKISFQHHDHKIILKPLTLREEFKDVFPMEIPHGLPPSRSIEHQVDLLPEASLPNRPTYNSKPQETQHKDAQAKVELLCLATMTYILHLIASMIFFNKSSSTYVHVAYLLYLSNLTVFHKYAWGVATIVYLYDHRSYASHYNNNVGYNEAKAYNVDDPLATRWKPLRGFGLALPVRDRLDDL